MYLKLSFQERTQARCMSLNLFYKLAEKPVIVEAIPSGVEAGKQVRIPVHPELDDMFGLLNACNYDYYLNCGDVDKETITRVVDELYKICGGEAPELPADNQYISESKNLFVHALNFTLETAKRDKGISSENLQKLLIKELGQEVHKHEVENMKKFVRMMMFGDSKESESISAEDVDEAEKLFSLLINAEAEDQTASPRETEEADLSANNLRK